LCAVENLSSDSGIHRIQLLLGGNDITEFLYVMLQRIGFPYKDADLSRTYDWAVFEDLKKTMCTLTEASLT
jgi:actin-related protein 8